MCNLNTLVYFLFCQGPLWPIYFIPCILLKSRNIQRLISWFFLPDLWFSTYTSVILSSSPFIHFYICNISFLTRLVVFFPTLEVLVFILDEKEEIQQYYSSSLDSSLKPLAECLILRGHLDESPVTSQRFIFSSN